MSVIVRSAFAVKTEHQQYVEKKTTISPYKFTRRLHVKIVP